MLDDFLDVVPPERFCLFGRVAAGGSPTVDPSHRLLHFGISRWIFDEAVSVVVANGGEVSPQRSRLLPLGIQGHQPGLQDLGFGRNAVGVVLVGPLLPAPPSAGVGLQCVRGDCCQ